MKKKFEMETQQLEFFQQRSSSLNQIEDLVDNSYDEKDEKLLNYDNYHPIDNPPPTSSNKHQTKTTHDFSTTKNFDGKSDFKIHHHQNPLEQKRHQPPPSSSPKKSNKKSSTFVSSKSHFRPSSSSSSSRLNDQYKTFSKDISYQSSLLDLLDKE